MMMPTSLSMIIPTNFLASARVAMNAAYLAPTADRHASWKRTWPRKSILPTSTPDWRSTA